MARSTHAYASDTEIDLGHIPPSMLAFARSEHQTAVAITTRRDVLNARVHDAVMKVVVADLLSAIEPRVAVWIAPQQGVALETLKSWLGDAGGLMRSRGQMARLGDHGRMVFLRASRAHMCPVEAADVVVLDRAESMPVDAYNAAVGLVRPTGGQVLAVGSLPPASHWSVRVKADRHLFAARDLEREGVVTAAEIKSARASVEKEAASMAIDCKRPKARKGPDLASMGFERYAGQYLIIRDLETDATVPLRFSGPQRAFLEERRKAAAAGKTRLVVLKGRRGGLSTLVQALSYYDARTRPNGSYVTLAQTADDTDEIFQITRMFADNDPLAPKVRRSGRRLLFEDLGSKISLGTAGARGAKRGATISRFHGSEVAFWCQGPNHAKRVQELLAGAQKATAHGEVILESTPNGVNQFHDIYTGAVAGTNSYHPVFLPWWLDDRNRLPLEAEIDDFAFGLQPDECRLARQWGYECDDAGMPTPALVVQWLEDDEVRGRFVKDVLERIAWRRAEKLELGVLFPQEYPEDDVSCWLVTGTPFFSLSAVDDRVRFIETGVAQSMEGWSEQRHPAEGGYVVEFEPPQPGVAYYLGADVSEGLSTSDRAGYGIVRGDTGVQVAAAHGLFTPEVLAYLCAKAHRRYGALLGIELNGPGLAVVTELKRMGLSSRYELFHSSTETAGWRTTAQTRPMALSCARQMVDRHSETVRDMEFLRECRTFKKQAAGKFEADPSAHDDAVMKWAIAYAIREMAPPLPGYAF